jgi:hypothetical protein
VLRARDAVLARPRRFDVGLATLDFGDEFTRLARAHASARELWVARSAEYLNWRFRDHFHLRFELLTARQGARLAGYAVLHECETSIDVVDIFWGINRPLLHDLLARTVQLARERDKDSVNVPMVDSAAALADLATAGFHPRERQPIVVYQGRAHSPGADVRKEHDWLLTAGDESD